MSHGPHYTQTEIKMKKVSQLLSSKSSELFLTSPDSLVLEALAIMAAKNVGALLVVEKEKLVGIISERDYARKVILKGKSSKETRVKEIMTTSLICVNQNNSVEECLTLMTLNHIRHLPVMDNSILVGMLSIGDLVKETISQQKALIQQLESYIHG